MERHNVLKYGHELKASNGPNWYYTTMLVSYIILVCWKKNLSTWWWQWFIFLYCFEYVILIFYFPLCRSEYLEISMLLLKILQKKLLGQWKFIVKNTVVNLFPLKGNIFEIINAVSKVIKWEEKYCFYFDWEPPSKL